MTTYERELTADLARLTPVSANKILAAFVASQRGGRCDVRAATAALSPIFAVEAGIEALQPGDSIQLSDGQLVFDAGAAHREGLAAVDTSGGWEAVRHRLALHAVSARPHIGAHLDHADLIGALLRQVYGLDHLSAFPSRVEVRCALLGRALKSLGGPFSQISAPLKKPFKFDALSRSLYLALAGLRGGQVAQADWAFVRKALVCKTPAELPNAILRAALQGGRAADRASSAPVRKEIAAKIPAPVTEAVAAKASESHGNLETFAKEVRAVAGKLETKPYSGRVAIAQVYDEGVAQGLPLGSLDTFKERLAEAAREGLLDLERYDITGPFDTGLKERSRLRFGRDERHFIVNQWI